MNERFQRLQALLSTNNVDALLITSPANIIYMTGYAGFSPLEREAYILITAKNAFLFTDGRYSEAVKIHIPHFTLCEITIEKPVTKHLEEITKKEKLKIVGFESSDLAVAEYTKIRKVAKLRPVDLKTLRLTKTEQELLAIKRACKIGDKAFDYLRSVIKPGMAEIDIADELEWFIRKHKGTLSFPSIVAFGPNSAIPHHHTSKQKLKKKDIVLLDFGVKYDSYCSDMTRTIFVGKPTEGQKRVYEVVLNAQKKAVEFLQNTLYKIPNTGGKAAKVDQVAREYITSQGFPGIPHSLGHGIGIEVHEAPSLSPRSKENLQDGMVFSIEPGIYLPGKFGVRIEDLFVTQNGKLLLLTKAPSALTQI